MKKIIMFFAGLIILILSVVVLYFTGSIYDASKNLTIVPYFFQPNYLSDRRLSKPLTETEIGENEFLNLLVQKYVTEYFYAIPDLENIAQRTLSNSTLAKLSNDNVFNEWLKTEEPVIETLAEHKALRSVKLLDKIYKPSDSKYWIVNYELTTLEKPNDFNQVPNITRGTLYMILLYEDGLKPDISIKNISESIKNANPITLFKFKVVEIIRGDSL